MADDNAYDVTNEDSDIAIEKPYFSSQMDLMTIFRQGEKAIFRCAAMGNPKPVITWLKNNESVSQKLVQNGELIFEKVNTTNSGIYTCTASNSAGSISRDFQNLVYNSESLPLIISENSTTYKNAMIVMRCPIETDIYQYVTWRKRGDWDEVPIQSEESSLPQLLILHSVTTADTGIYTCSVNSTTGSIYLKVIDLNNHSMDNQDMDDNDTNDHEDGPHEDPKTSTPQPPTGYLNPNVSEEAPKFTKRLLPTLLKPAGNCSRKFIHFWSKVSDLHSFFESLSLSL